MRLVLGLIAILLLHVGLHSWQHAEATTSVDLAFHSRLAAVGSWIASGCFALACAVVHAGRDLRTAVDLWRTERAQTGRPPSTGTDASEPPATTAPSTPSTKPDAVALTLGLLVVAVCVLAIAHCSH